MPRTLAVRLCPSGEGPDGGLENEPGVFGVWTSRDGRGWSVRLCALGFAPFLADQFALLVLAFVPADSKSPRNSASRESKNANSVSRL